MHYAVGFFIQEAMLVLIVLVEALVLLAVPARVGVIIMQEVRRNAS